MNSIPDHKRAGLAWGSFIGDALAMPVHWYYDRAALRRDYGVVRDYEAPRNPHADSILWRSEYVPVNDCGDILHEQAPYWGKRGIHYHQFLHTGENTLNLQLAKVLIESLIARGGYDGDDYLQRYVDFMLTPGRHRDTYVEEYLAWKYADDFEAGVIANANVGGDNCHRGAVLGAMLGAAAGTDRMASRFFKRLHAATVLRQLVDKLLGAGKNQR